MKGKNQEQQGGGRLEAAVTMSSFSKLEVAPGELWNELRNSS